jgi:hypothetical protein
VGGDLIESIKKTLLILFSACCLCTSVFAQTKMNASQPIKDTVFRVYGNWDACEDFIEENNIIYPLKCASLVEDKGIIATYQIPRIITRKYYTWESFQKADSYIEKFNLRYDMKEAKRLGKSQVFAVTYELKGQ